MKFFNERAYVRFIVTTSILISDTVNWKPFFVVLKFRLHLIKIYEEIVFLSVMLTKVELHSSVVTRLKACLSLLLVVVEIFIEVGHLFVR